MHMNPAFRKTARDACLAFARECSFGILAVNGPDAPMLSHVPFLISPDDKTLDLHLMRSNPIARREGELDAVIAVQGPDGYISPDWYEVSDQVPTWNYVAVHLRGRLERLPQEAMRDMLDRQSASFETRLSKPPWTAEKMTPDVLERMMRQILPFRMRIDDVQGTWKLGQNKTDDARRAAAGHLATSGIGTNTQQLSDLMRDPPQTPPSPQT